MKNKSLTPVAAIVVLVLVGLVYLLSSVFDSTRWNYSLKEDEGHPYDISIADSLIHDFKKEDGYYEIEDSLRNFFSVRDSLDSTENGRSNYLLIEKSTSFNGLMPDFGIPFTQVGPLKDWVAKGNRAFIISSSLNYNFFDQLCSDLDIVEVEDSVFTTRYVEEDLNTSKYRFHSLKDWEYQNIVVSAFHEDSCADMKSLGLLNDSLANFIAVPYGEGHFFLHTNPQFFTNYFLTSDTEAGLNYLEGYVSYFNEGPLYYDLFSKYPMKYRKKEEGDVSSWEKPAKNTREYINESKSLMAACMVGAGMILLYLFFGTKREQKMIPPIEKNENTSIEFGKAIGRLYARDAGHNRLFELNRKVFLNYVRNRYHIAYNKLDEGIVKELVQKSGISQKQVEELIKLFRRFGGKYQIDDDQFIKFYLKLEAFYKNCN